MTDDPIEYQSRALTDALVAAQKELIEATIAKRKAIARQKLAEQVFDNTVQEIKAFVFQQEWASQSVARGEIV